jgi:hypothetical protein
MLADHAHDISWAVHWVECRRLADGRDVQDSTTPGLGECRATGESSGCRTREKAESATRQTSANRVLTRPAYTAHGVLQYDRIRHCLVDFTELERPAKLNPPPAHLDCRKRKRKSFSLVVDHSIHPK